MHLPAWALAIAERLAFRGEANRDVVGMLDAFTLLFSFLSLAASVATFLLSWRKPPVEEAAEVNGSGESNVSSSRRKEEQEEVPIARRLAHADQTPTELPGVPDAVGPEDGEEFSQRIEKFPDELPFNHDRWELIVTASEEGSLKHRCYRYTFDDGTTTYLSESIVENARPEQIIRFYLADEERHNWDDTYHHGETLLTDPKTGAEVLHYVRNFPLLCAPRDYVFSRRSFVKGDSYITVSKSCTLQDKPPDPSGAIKRVDVYESSWSCQAVKGKDGRFSATRVLLYHYEDQKLNQDVSRMVVRRGMWPQVRKCFTVGLRNFVDSGRDAKFSQSLRGMPREEGEGLSMREAVPSSQSRAHGIGKKKDLAKKALGGAAILVGATAAFHFWGAKSIIVPFITRRQNNKKKS